MNASCTDRPILWMLADCPPARDGDNKQRRVWDLIKAARPSHRVVLTVITRHPVWLEQWRTIHDHVDVFDLQPIGLLHSLPHTRSVPAAIAGEAIDVVVATTPRLWTQARYIPCRTTVCDQIPRTQEHTRGTHRYLAGISSFIKPLQRTQDAAATAMLECDLAITENSTIDPFVEHLRGGYADDDTPCLKLTPADAPAHQSRLHAA